MKEILGEISHSHSDENENGCLLGCRAEQLDSFHNKKKTDSIRLESAGYVSKFRPELAYLYSVPEFGTL
jgi:hypothetical protein